MKGNFPTWVYYLITIAGTAVLIAGAALELNIATTAIGAGLFAYGVNRLIGEWRVRNNPDYAKQLEIANKDERLAYIADKSRSMTLMITIIVLAVLSVVLQSIGMKTYGLMCSYILCGIAFLYFISYRILSRKY